MKWLICLDLTISIDGIPQTVKGLHDSGAQISVIHPDLIKDILSKLPREGTVKLKGLIGDPIDADLISLSIKLSDSCLLYTSPSPRD